MTIDSTKRAEERFVEATLHAARRSLERDEPFPSIGTKLASRYWGHARARVRHLRAGAAISIATFLCLGSLGAAGALPGGIQAAVARTVALVGLEFPQNEDKATRLVPPATTDTPAPPPTRRAPTSVERTTPVAVEPAAEPPVEDQTPNEPKAQPNKRIPVSVPVVEEPVVGDPVVDPTPPPDEVTPVGDPNHPGQGGGRPEDPGQPGAPPGHDKLPKDGPTDQGQGRRSS